MFDKIKKEIFKDYKVDESKWVFFSLFDFDNKLIFSQWVAKSTNNLWELLDKLYFWFVDTKIEDVNYVIVDIVDNITTVAPKDFFAVSTKDNWVWVIPNGSDNVFAILPNTEWVADAKHALSVIKNKVNLTWNVSLFKFTTNRLVFKN